MEENYTVTFDGQVEAILVHSIDVKIKGQDTPNSYPVKYVVMPDHADSTEGVFKGWRLSDTGTVYPKGTTVFINKSMSFKPVYIKQLAQDIPWTAHLTDGKFNVFPYDVDASKFIDTNGVITNSDLYKSEMMYSLSLPYNDIYLTNNVYSTDYNNWKEWGILDDKEWLEKSDTLLTRHFYPYSSEVIITLPNTLIVVDSTSGEKLGYTELKNNKREFKLVDRSSQKMSAYSLRSYSIVRDFHYVDVKTTEEQ